MTLIQLFDSLPTHIEDALRESIRRFGVLVPVRALPSGVERAAAKAYHENHAEPEPEQLKVTA